LTFTIELTYHMSIYYILPFPLISLSLYIYHQVDENLKRAHVRDAVHNQKFWFRKYLVSW